MSVDHVHVVCTDDPETWDDAIWVMRCGLMVRAHDDGSLSPPIDFVGPAIAEEATCAGCREYRVELERARAALVVA